MPGRPAATIAASRTRTAEAHSASRSSPRAPSSTSASVWSSALPSRARASARRIALSAICEGYGTATPATARRVTAVATAAVAASCPLSSREPSSPARSSA